MSTHTIIGNNAGDQWQFQYYNKQLFIKIFWICLIVSVFYNRVLCDFGTLHVNTWAPLTCLKTIAQMPCETDLIALEELKKYLPNQARKYIIRYCEDLSFTESGGWDLLHSMHTFLLFLPHLLSEAGQHFGILYLLKPLQALHCGTTPRLDFCKMK